ncbi:PX domain-containing protein YPT35 [Spathaspora sp. JA1]|nr:PX domain-containing protein YPT35 [Spathaspora sp. JA1]
MNRSKSNSISRLNEVLPIPIELHNGEDLDHNPNDTSTTHITDVLVGEHHLIQGTSGSSYMVWAIKITVNDLEYSSIIKYKRYNEIVEFRSRLVEYFKHDSITIPGLPPRDSFNMDRILLANHWLEERRRGLQWFMTNVLLDPVIQKSPIVKQFIENN